MVQKRGTKATNKLCVREILGLSFVCGAYFFEFRGWKQGRYACALPFSRVPKNCALLAEHVHMRCTLSRARLMLIGRARSCDMEKRMQEVTNDRKRKTRSLQVGIWL